MKAVLPRKFAKKIDPASKYLVVYCTGYTRALEAARDIAAATDTPVRVLVGGISGWLTV